MGARGGVAFCVILLHRPVAKLHAILALAWWVRIQRARRLVCAADSNCDAHINSHADSACNEYSMALSTPRPHSESGISIVS